MGYLSQKKKALREVLILKITILFFVLATVFSLVSDAEWLFQIYFLQFFFFLYTLLTRRFSYTFMFFVLLTINYFQISSVSYLFFNNKNDEYDHYIKATYFPDQAINFDDSQIVSRKVIKIEDEKEFHITKIVVDQKEITFLSVNLANISSKERKQYLKVLSDFIKNESSSVVVIGDFGIPAWYKDMRLFIENNNLEVKNPLVFAQQGQRYNYLKSPSFYVLSFKNIGLSNIILLSPENSQSYPRIKLDLGLRNF